MKKPRIYLESLAQLLDSGEKFAEKHHRTFREVFRLSHFVLQSKELSFELDEAAAGGIVHSYGFSDDAEDNFRCLWDSLKEHPNEWTSDQKKLYLVYSLTDIFGGMGSWNDASNFKSPEVRKEYAAITEELINVRKKISQLLDLAPDPN